MKRDFDAKKVSALGQENRELAESVTKYSVHAQKLKHELTEVATKYSQRAQKLERELTETATTGWDAAIVQFYQLSLCRPQTRQIACL